MTIPEQQLSNNNSPHLRRVSVKKAVMNVQEGHLMQNIDESPLYAKQNNTRFNQKEKADKKEVVDLR